MHDDYLKYLEQFDLRVVHTGGDYGNFLCWALGWLDNLEYQSIESVITDIGSAHNHSSNFIDRCSDHHLKDANTSSGIVRLHYDIHDIESDILAIADTGPTVVIDPTNCILELINNRQTKMPAGSFRKIKNTVDLAAEISTFQHVANKIKSVKHCNLRLLKMKQLTNRSAKNLTDLYNWWKHKSSVRSAEELEECVNYWQDQQEFLNHDENILALYRTRNPILQKNIPEISRDKIRKSLEQLTTISDVDRIMYHQCLNNLSDTDSEFLTLKDTPLVKNIYPAVFVSAQKINENLNKVYNMAIGQDLRNYNLVLHDGGAYGHWLIYLLEFMSGKTDLSFDQAVQLDGSSHGYHVKYIHWDYSENMDTVESTLLGKDADKNQLFVRCHHLHWSLLQKWGLTTYDWIEYLKTKCNKIIIIQSKGHELEQTLNSITKTSHLWLQKNKKRTALEHANTMFDSSDQFDNVVDDSKVKKINLEEITTHTQETAQNLLSWLHMDMIKSTNIVDSIVKQWQQTQEFINIDKEYDKINGSFGRYAKHKQAVKFIEQFFSDAG